MLIGILSDSHGRAKAVRRALKFFDERGVELIIHCGDVGGLSVFDELVGRPVHFVWGNTDEPDGALIAYLKSVLIPAPEEIPLRLDVADKKIAIFHGHEPGFIRAERSMAVDYLLHGHTHVARDERRGSTRIINPGALHRAAPKTMALLDTVIDKLEFHPISGD